MTFFKRAVLLPAILSLSVISLSCGYSATSLLPAHLRTIYIEPIKNSINFTAEWQRNLYIPLLEVKVRNAVINRYLLDGSLKIADADKADLILKAELLNYASDELRVSDENTVDEYRITITVSLQLFDTRKQEARWREASFSGEKTYNVSGPLAKSEETARQEAIEDLARRVVERTIEDW